MAIIFFDVETTGLNPNVNDITELGALLMDENLSRTAKTFHKRLLIQNPDSVEADALAIGHYDENIWSKTAVTAEAGLLEFNDWLKTVSPDSKPTFAATNSDFDKGFLYSNCDRFKIAPFVENSWLDLIAPWTLYKLKNKLMHLGNSQATIAEHLGVKNIKAHAALYDAAAGAECLSILYKMMSFDTKQK